MMDRDTAVMMLETVQKIEKLLDDAPHGVAMKIKGELAFFEGVADGQFPGGYGGVCIRCDAPMGSDEAVGEEHCCSQCWERYKADMAVTETPKQD